MLCYMVESLKTQRTGGSEFKIDAPNVIHLYTSRQRRKILFTISAKSHIKHIMLAPINTSFSHSYIRNIYLPIQKSARAHKKHSQLTLRVASIVPEALRSNTSRRAIMARVQNKVCFSL